MKKRFMTIGIAITVIFVFLMARLTFVQVINGAVYKEEAQRRQQTSLSGLAIRGVIYDRNMESLTNREKSYIMFVPKNKLTTGAQALLTQIDGERISNSNLRYYVYRSSRHDQTISEELSDKYDVFEFSMNRRYSANQTAEHIIGYINARDNKGQSGIELAFDEFLCIPDDSYYVIMDGMRRILPGYGMNLNSEIERTGIVTTIDYEIQKKTEEIMEESGVNGSAVVLDSQTGDLLASVSTPGYDPNRVQDYIDSSGDELINKAIRGEYPPGSVFKIIMLAVAVESEKYTEDSMFFCGGYEEINGVKIACASEKSGGHGAITLKKAFEVSCNSVFIQIGKELGGESILQYASKFGLGKKTLEYMKDEKKGNLPHIYDVRGAGIGNLSIGQGELTATPIQIARMTNVIAAGGVDRGVRLIQREMSDGKTSKEYAAGEGTRIISGETAQFVQEMMEAVVSSGTGDNIKLAPGIIAGGKTSSAQSSDGGEKVVHGWFSGYVGMQEPKYTITVFVKNGKSGRQSAAPLFEKIANAIMY